LQTHTIVLLLLTLCGLPLFSQDTPVASRKAPHVTKVPSALFGRVMYKTPEGDEVPVPNAQVSISRGAKRIAEVRTDSDGIFRVGGLNAGAYDILISADGALIAKREGIAINESESVALEFVAPMPKDLARPRLPGKIEETPTQPSEESTYREVFRRPAEVEVREEELAPEDKVFQQRADRWDVPMPEWRRYERPGEFPYVRGGHWFDPFNQNRVKGDKPIIGQQTFFNFTGTSVTAFDLRRLPVGSGVSAADPGSSPFFGKGRQVFLAETARFSFDLFHGDTSFRPVDWRIRFTPAVNINQLWTRERGIVNRDVRKGTDRTDAHVGLQEAFVEYKLRDLSPNFDFISVRAGIQQFASDFRGFIYAQEHPGVRFFGNLRSNRFQYNAAYFYFLEKDTNSVLNTFQGRDQQMVVANLYIHDFIKHGYTTQFSYHFNKDDGKLHFDENDFIVRPAAIGAVQRRDIRAHYIGWTSNGHIGRLNVSHAAYQVLGRETFSSIAGRPVDINAQMAALELSYDRDWIRFRTSAFFASGDKNPRDRIARGFDSIVEAQTFAGGPFSFFNRQGIALTGTNVPLTAPDSFLPDLRSNKDEGKSNFVNPGIMLVNAGVDVEVTTKMRAFVNVNAMRFHHTEPLQLLLFQSKIRNSIGLDYGAGLSYRPPLSDNIVITGGVAALTPGTGLRQIYTSKTLVSAFSLIKFQF
jgi:hypothetical protein